MTTPAFVNIGAVSSSGIGTSNTPPLPATRTTGNILIAVCGVFRVGQTLTVNSGWNLGAVSANGSLASRWAWRVVDGSETAPVFSWGTTTSNEAFVTQWTGTSATAPFGAIDSLTGSGTAYSSNGITTTANNSNVIMFGLAANSAALTLPAFFTSRLSGSGARVADQPDSIGSFVQPSGTINVSGAWSLFTIEMLEAAPVPAGNINQTLGRVTQTATGRMNAKGTVAQTLGRVTQAAAGREFLGSISQTLGRVTQAATGLELPRGAIVQTLGRVTQSAAGVTSSDHIAQTLGRVTQSVAGWASASGAVTQTLGRISQTATGWDSPRGIIVQSLGRVTQNVSARLGVAERGPIVQTLGRVTQIARGVVPAIGAIGQTLGRVTQTARGVEIFTGTIYQTLPRVRQTVIGAQLGPTGPLHTGSFYSWRG